MSISFSAEKNFIISNPLYGIGQRKCYIERLDTRVIMSILMYFTQARHDYILREREAVLHLIFM